MQANPMEYFRIFFRRKWFIIIPAFTGMILGVCSAIIMPKKYVSSTKIQIMEGNTENPLFDQLTVSSTMEQRSKVVREKMLSWGSLTELVKRLKLDNQVKSAQDFEELIKQLVKNIKFEFREANIIQVSYAGPNALQTQAVVQNIMQIFIEGSLTVQTKETSDAIRFIEEQLRVYRGKIKSSEIAQLKDRLNELLVDSTEMHPQVKQLRDQINLKMEEIRKEDLEYSEDARLSAESTSQMLQEIRKALNVVSKKETEAPVADASATDEFYKVMLIDKADNVRARDVDVNTNIYNSLLQRLETAKITQRLQSSKEGTRYTVLDPPRVPLKPSQPKMIINVIMGILLGLGIGGAMVFLTEFLDKSFLDVQEAKEFLGAPLLGSISKITTAELLEEDRQRQTWLLFWMGSSGVLLIAFTVMLSAIFHI
ncbi:MAG: hypothetical protein KA403_03355 [Candidatus Omnitrophica bacterium]|nr:hypothetical protein [Candidatus Omnitrophota bacterium]